MSLRIFGTVDHIEEYDALKKSVQDVDDTITHHQYLENTPVSHDSAILSAIVTKYPFHMPYAIAGMNELYVSAIGSGGSDRVFETPHIDGLFAWLPGCKVLRCVVALQGNESVCTSFQYPDETYILKTGTFLAFDYNRDIHYIWKKEGVEDPSKRIILKLHYLMAPRKMPLLVVDVYRAIHTHYNAGLRNLFLNSQNTESLVGGAISLMINGGTRLYVAIFLAIKWIHYCFVKSI